MPPKSFLKDLRAFCDKNKILLILDEVQTGFGRTGKWFAFEHFDVKPDILVMAKGIASGVPLSGIIASNDLMGKWKPGSHGGTYGGNAVSCAGTSLFFFPPPLRRVMLLNSPNVPSNERFEP